PPESLGGESVRGAHGADAWRESDPHPVSLLPGVGAPAAHPVSVPAVGNASVRSRWWGALLGEDVLFGGRRDLLSAQRTLATREDPHASACSCVGFAYRLRIPYAPQSQCAAQTSRPCLQSWQ